MAVPPGHADIPSHDGSRVARRRTIATALFVTAVAAAPLSGVRGAAPAAARDPSPDEMRFLFAAGTATVTRRGVPTIRRSTSTVLPWMVDG
jgi:hypothetical protein